MNEHERLIELMKKWTHSPSAVYGYDGLADYLLENGVVVLPFKVGDTVYTNLHICGDYLKKKDAPYELRIIFVGINDSLEFGGGYVNAEYIKTGRQVQIHFADFGKTVFFTKEEAERALKGGAVNE